jgi:NADPH:quinone reductase-like Zn-dependent oxidoreductase
MTRRNKILGVISLLLVVTLASLAFAISHNSPCVAGAPAEGAQRMKAVVYRCYGSPEVLKVEDIAMPTAGDNQVLVKVHAASVNPVDWHSMRGSPYLMRLSSGVGTPKETRIGVDYSGTVVAVGKSVTQFKPGDEVFGGRDGALAEYVVVREKGAIAHKPDRITFAQAASVGVAAITALQGLRDHGGVQPGQKVLINGASGGVGTFAVQIAKSLGANVTGVCSTRNVDLVKSLGADRVIDYTNEDFAQSDDRYDMILDNVGNRSLSDLRRVLKPKGALVMVGAAKGDWIGPLTNPLKAVILSPFIDEKLGMFIAEFKQPDLELLAALMQEGKVTPVIDRQYTLSETAAAMAYLEEGRARGKVVVNMESQSVSQRE